MAQWLDALSKSERLAYPFTYAGLRQGQSASETLKQFRAGGGRIRTQSFYNLFRFVQDLVDRGSRVRFLNRTATPRRESLPEIGTRQLREYSFRVEVRGLAPRREEDEGYFVTVSSSTLMSRGEIEEMAESIMSTSYQDAQSGSYEYVLVHGQRSAGL